MSDHVQGPGDDREIIEHLLGANDRADGTTPIGDEEVRRQRALQLRALLIAEKYGLKIEDVGQRATEPARSTPTAAQIKSLAAVTMPQADAQVRTKFERIDVKLADGTRATRTTIELGVLDQLGKSLGTVAEAPGKLLSWAGRGICTIGIKVGKFFRADAKVDAVGVVNGDDEAKDDSMTGA